MIYRRIDEEGFFLEDVVSDRAITDARYLTAAPAQGFYRPRWNGERWTEGASAEEIEAMSASEEGQQSESEEEKRIRLLEAQVKAAADQAEVIEGVLQELILETMA